MQPCSTSPTSTVSMYRPSPASVPTRSGSSISLPTMRKKTPTGEYLAQNSDSSEAGGRIAPSEAEGSHHMTMSTIFITARLRMPRN